jgi:predicted helicase
MTLEQYISNINQRYKLGNSTEHTFRGDLQQLIESLLPEIKATNEPKRQSCGAPDYILTKKEIPIAFIEAKNIGEQDLPGTKKAGNKEQFDRYRESLGNIIFTDYLTFLFYRDNEQIAQIAIGVLTAKGIKPLPENFSMFENLLKQFCSHISQTIKNPKQLAEMMANKAKLLAGVIEKALYSDENNFEDSTLKDQLEDFKRILVHDITKKEFADVYAQTIAYGMFAARLHDETLNDFTRQEAAELIPKSNPFLRNLFGYIAGPNIDDRIKWIVDSLANVFLHCNVEEILSGFGKSTKTEDPIIHFYETFLTAYDPKLRKSRGVWYTPAPVVNFIVRAVDDILKTEFNLPQGLADKSKIKTKVIKDGVKTEQEVHKVQILDPATGTGTFLAEVIRQVYKRFEGQEGIWNNYVENDLLPRLNGFELLMASYAMAHLKLDLLLRETGYKHKSNNRFRVFLTNSLEESHSDLERGFANWLTQEAKEANSVKRDTPVMVIIGNPPYAVSSTNKGGWIQNLMTDYKKDLNERKINLDDDYIKFIRYGQYYIQKNGSGILAYISNNSFIDGITHRQMRKNLMETFDKVYIIDLHGNSKKKETSPDASADQNVFDIMQGVSVNIFVKISKIKPEKICNINHFDLYGKREDKYNFLNENSISAINWNELKPEEPYMFFVPKDFEEINEYEKGFKIDELFGVITSGMQTKRDNLCISKTHQEMIEKIDFIRSNNVNEIRIKYCLPDDGRDWKIKDAKTDIETSNGSIQNILYRPFDFRKTYYSGKTKGFIAYPRREKMNNFIDKDNLGLIAPRMCKGKNGFEHGFITKYIVDIAAGDAFSGIGTFIFPLYLYPEIKDGEMLGETARKPNLNLEIVKQIAEALGLTYTIEKETTEGTFAPIDILDYIYAVLHSPAYREKYKEFLKIDFPRVPYPKKETFWQLVKLGGELRQIHLLESPIVENFITRYPISGENEVGKVQYLNGKVYINDTQHFTGVPEVAWNFYIGGYQPAQKWLKDRKGRQLEFDDIMHYQKIIVALTETDRLMKEIDKIEVE